MSNINTISLLPAEQSNAHPIASAVTAWRFHTAKAEVAVGDLAAALADIWDVPLFASIGKGDNVVTYPFNIGDMYDDRHHANGDKVPQATFIGACYATLATEYGVLGGFVGKEKVMIKRARRLAGASVILGHDIKFGGDGVTMPAGVIFELTEVKAVEVETTETVINADTGEEETVVTKTTEQRTVPTELGTKLMDRVKSNAKLFGQEVDDETALAGAKAIPLLTDGKVHDLLDVKVPVASELADKFAQELTRAGFDAWKPRSTPEKAKGQEFGACLEYVTKCVSEVLDPAGEEAGFAPCNESLKALGDLYEKIGALLAAEGAADLLSAID